MASSSFTGVRAYGFAAALGMIVLGACASSNGGEQPVGGDGGEPGDGGAPRDTADPENVFYVAMDGADWNTGDEPAHPFRTVGHAITAAAACTPAPCRVRISQGTYVEVVTLAAGVDLEGGWAPGFTGRDLILHRVVLTSEDAITVIAEALDARTTLDGLNVLGADLSAGTDGTSSTGLRVRDSGEHLRLRAVRVEGGRGARGVDGADGSLIACTALGGAGGTAYDCGGNNGLWGNASGDPTMAGNPGTPGSSNCPNACPLVGSDGISGGASGGNGVNGAEGAAGSPGMDIDGGFVADAWVGDLGVAAGRGGHGTGGSGGGPGGSKRFRACFGCGTLDGGRGGDGAPGGCGGGGGTSGGAGGASFAIVVVRSTLLIDDVGVAGGIGGPGGAGGDGHPGSPGGTDGSVGQGGSPSQQCGAITYRAGAGAAGGIGGHGGHGGGGAGGVGGPSIGVALVTGGVASFGEPGVIEVEVGTAGLGGAGGTGLFDAMSGPDGRAAQTVSY